MTCEHVTACSAATQLQRLAFASPGASSAPMSQISTKYRELFAPRSVCRYLPSSSNACTQNFAFHAYFIPGADRRLWAHCAASHTLICMAHPTVCPPVDSGLPRHSWLASVVLPAPVHDDGSEPVWPDTSRPPGDQQTLMLTCVADQQYAYASLPINTRLHTHALCRVALCPA